MPLTISRRSTLASRATDERPLDDRRAARDVAGRERVLRGVEHLGDRRDELNGAVVDELGQPPALVTLGA